MNRLALYADTLRHLRPSQLWGQVRHRLRPKPTLLDWPTAAPAVSGRAFTFLNQSVRFSGPVDWNYPLYGKLWTYHLNYFEQLNTLDPADALALMREYVGQTATLRDGLEPYPTSLRIINWISFLHQHSLHDAALDQHLRAQGWLLFNNVEHHLSGNHLLENGLALLAGGWWLAEPDWLRRAERLLRAELAEQILPDGGHYERSATYHQQLLGRVLDVLTLARTTPAQPDLQQLLRATAARMLGWLDAVTFADGAVPLLNDAAPEVSPTTVELRARAAALGITPQTATLSESGFRRMKNADFDLVADVGTPGPAHQPGHAHASTLSFVLYVADQPVVVDTGVSTYEVGERRQWERSTAAHNTVTVQEEDSSAVWAGFRVGRRARATLLHDQPGHLSARHDGYRHQGLHHQRTWTFATERTLRITDDLMLYQRRPLRARLARPVGPVPRPNVARLHFAPGLMPQATPSGWRVGPLRVTFATDSPAPGRRFDYQMAAGFNQLVPAAGLAVSFRQTLITDLTVV